MGHRRVGMLPKTQRWRDLVDQLESFSGDESELASVVSRTLDGVRGRFAKIDSDQSIHAAFEFLVALAFASGTEDPAGRLSDIGIEIREGQSPLALARALASWVEERTDLPEYASIAKAAACDALSAWYRKNAPETKSLFGEDADRFAVWRRMSSGAGFCELARLFFSSCTERHLRYFIEREASRVIDNLFERDRFDRLLTSHIDDVSRHAFETAKITQSFAAGWFNKHARTELPSEEARRAFLSLAFGKLRDELRREVSE